MSLVQLRIAGGFTPYNCTSASYQQFGLEINAILDDYGVGVAGVGDNAAFLARVCPEPIVHRRRLAAAKASSGWVAELADIAKEITLTREGYS
jgi:hypothetical protein